MVELQNLQDAIKLLKAARLDVANGSNVVWNKLYNATEYLDKQVKTLLAE